MLHTPSAALAHVIEAAGIEAGYPLGVTVSDAELAAVRLESEAFHGSWNDALAPQTLPN